jgi:UDPglucose 6-dehydrogenase
VKIVVVGLGPFGLSYSVWLASKGHNVLGIDINQEIVEKANKGKILFEEPQVSELLESSLDGPGFLAVSDYEHPFIPTAEIVFVIVQTPLDEETGMLNYQHVKQALCSLLKANEKILVVIRSTLPLGAMRELEVVYPNIVYMPEFLAYGRIIEDFENPNSHLIGGNEKICKSLVKMLKKIDNTPIFFMKFGSAELAKLGINVALSAKVSLINQLQYIGELFEDIDINEVYEILRLDSRFNPTFLRPGATFGGKCFVKDLTNLITQSRLKGYKPRFIEGIFDLRTQYAIREVDKMGDVKNVVLSGLAYKVGLNFVDHSPGLLILTELINREIKVTVIEKEEVIIQARKWLGKEAKRVNWVVCDRYVKVVPG